MPDNPFLRRLQVEDNWALNVARDTYKQEYLNYWNAYNGGNPPDVILCPAAPTPASRHDQSK
jgi:hypothetical protein